MALLDRVEHMVIALAEIAQGLASLVTMCLYRPSWTVSVRLWHLTREGERQESANARAERAEAALREILADHDERVRLYNYDTQPNRTRVLELGRDVLRRKGCKQ